MCKAISGVAVRVDESSVRVYTSPDSDSHTYIRVLHNINDTSKMSRYQTPVELVPIGDVDLFDTARWTFEFDDERPDWWTEDMTMQARKQLDTAWQARWSSSGLMFNGDLGLSSLTSLPENASLSAGGYLYLNSLTSLPENASLSAGGDLDLSSLTSLPENASLSAGGYLDLNSLTSLPENAPNCRGYRCADGVWRVGKRGE